MSKTQIKTKKKQSFPTLWVGLAAVLLIILAVIILPQLGNKDATTSLPLTVSVEKAAEIRDAGAFVLDVRQPDEWEQAHIPGRNPDSAGRVAEPHQRSSKGSGGPGVLPVREPFARGARYPAGCGL